MTYTTDFYAQQRLGMQASAERIVPVLYSTFRPLSVIDWGCGDGWWLEAFHELDSQLQLVGVESPSSEIRPSSNLTVHRTDLGELRRYGRFDLALCLEVAEHLPSNQADTLVANLCESSNIVIFSAAIPKQTGLNHINEQYPSYWLPKFARQGYKASAYFRYLFWNDPRIETWYRQNILLFQRAGRGYMFESAYGLVLDVVHPALWEYFRK